MTIEKAVYIAYVVDLIVLLIDWRQTLNIAHHKDIKETQNILIGEHPTNAIINVYFSSVLIACSAFILFIPNIVGDLECVGFNGCGSNWQLAFCVLILVFEIPTIINNHQLGL